MSGYRFATLTCDHCFEVWDDAQSFTIRDARKTAKDAGWVARSGGKDYCPRCVRVGRTFPRND